MTAHEIFNVVRKLPASRQEEYLEQACGDNAGLIERVRDLLASDAEINARLDSIAAKNSPSGHPEPAEESSDSFDPETSPPIRSDAMLNSPDGEPGKLNPGERIGPFKLLHPLGKGGMGEVWMAEQSEPVKRLVALKVIKRGFGSKEVLARFEAERQALALMNHPNIARILDVGTTPDGQPYFAMELVQGKPLTTYCDENRLGINERLELFHNVCHGVQHAHQKGIIHRDLKPGNILVSSVDGKAAAKVIDFGLAKAMESTQRLTEKSLFTGVGQILGTLKYMSPEQASLDTVDIDIRTDIYALGVILYELLTGSTPLDDSSIKGQAAIKVLEFIRDKEPVKPSSKFSSSTDEQISAITDQRQTDSGRLNRVLAGDLDWIVMKALEKDRTRRYESASGFAADVRRYLDNEPVIARPPSMNYRMRKFVRKNRVGVVAASLVALALIGGIAGTSLAMFRAQQAERDAIAAREEEADQRKEAEQSRALAESRRREAEKNLAFARKGNKILGLMFVDLDPEAAYSEVSELRDALRANLIHAIEELQGSAIGEPLEVAEMQSILGQSLAGLGEPHLAVEVTEKVLETRKTLLGPDHPKTIRSLGDLGAFYKRAGKLDQAVAMLEDALARCRSVNGPVAEETLANMNNLAMAYKESGSMDKAVALLEEALAHRKAKFGIDALETLSIVSNLAACYVDAGSIDKALPLLENVHAIRKAKLGPDHPSTLTSQNNRAITYQKSGNLAKALPLLKETLELRMARLGPDHPSTFASTGHLARVYSKLDQPDKAQVLYEESLKLRKAKLGADHPDTLNNMINLGANYLDLGMIEEALTLLEDAFSRTKAKLGADHFSTLSCMNNLFRAYRKSNQPDKALPILGEALTLRKAKLGLDHPDTVSTMNSLADYYDSLEKHDQALPLYEQLLEVTTAKQGLDHADTLQAMNELADCCLAAGQLEKGFLLYEQVVELKKTRFGADDKRTIDSVTRLGMSHLEAGQPGKAIPLLEQALSLKGTKYAFDDASTLRSMIRLATAYLANDKADKAEPLFEQRSRFLEAEELLRECLKIRQETQPDSWRIFDTQSMLGAALLGQSASVDDKTKKAKLLTGAESLLVDGYEGMKQREASIPPNGATRISEALDRLIELYTILEKPDDARNYRDLRAAYPPIPEK